MRINNLGGGIDSAMVDRIMDAERGPMKALAERRGRVVAEKNEYSTLSGLLNDLGSVARGIKVPAGFRQLAFNSSNADILDGVVDGPAMPGSFEVEVRGLAGADKHLEAGFPDRDKTAVGFGFMQIETSGQLQGVLINPGATLNDVVGRINSAGAGVRASVVNTGFPDDPFKLLVVSEKTGEEAKIHLDPDTTYLDFKNFKTGRNLAAQFEGVDVTRSGNQLDDLVDGVKMTAKRAAPGTRVQVNIVHDLEKTLGSIKQFADKYNQVAHFMNQQFTVDQGQAAPQGKLAGDGNVRNMMRSLQAQLSGPLGGVGKFKSLAEVGISTNAKSGELVVDEKKLKAALASDYDEVSKLFTVSEDGGEGVAARVSKALQQFQDPVSGVLSTRMHGLDAQIKDQDHQIEQQGRRLDERKETLERQFSALGSKVASLNQQGDFLAARLGGEAQQAPAAAAGPGKNT